MKKKLSYLLVLLLIVSMSTSICFASTNEAKIPLQENSKSYKVDSIQDLNRAIDTKAINNKVSAKDANAILEEVDPDVLADYIKDVDQSAMEYFETAEPIEEDYDAKNDETIAIYRTQIDPLTTVELVLTDCEEPDYIASVGKTIKKLFIDECYAASNGDTLWKPYGKRYYTAKYTRSIGTGYATIATENHYTISKGRITERYGKTWLHGMSSITGDIYDKGHSVFPDATKAGTSTKIRTRVTFKYKTSGGGASAYSYYTVYENLKIKFVKDNPTKKQMKVTYSWAKTNI